MDSSKIEKLSTNEKLEILNAIIKTEKNLAITIFGVLKNNRNIPVWSFVNDAVINEQGNIELVGEYFSNGYSDDYMLQLVGAEEIID